MPVTDTEAAAAARFMLTPVVIRLFLNVHLRATMRDPVGNAYPEPFDAEIWGEDGMRDGGDGILTDNGTLAGGAVFFAEDAENALIDCVFDKNSAYDVGGPEDPEDPAEDRDYTLGGAVYTESNVTLDLQNCEFRENIAGALYCSTGVVLDIDGCVFTNNSTADIEAVIVDPGIPGPLATSRDLAGGLTIELGAGAVTQISNTRFLGNTSEWSGGAILTFSDIFVEDSSFSANSADVDGGAFYSYYDTPDLSTHTVKLDFVDCEFIDNEAPGFGGAGYVKTGIINLEDCFFLQNTASSGGALYAIRSDLQMQGGLVYGNEVLGAGVGKYRTDQNEGFGGGLFALDCEVSIADARILHNSSSNTKGCGGGLYLSGGQTYKEINLLNCVIADNESANSAGGLACRENVLVEIASCTIANNTSHSTLGGGVFVDRTSEVLLSESIVSGNKGYGIYEKQDTESTTTGGDSYATYTLFYGNTDADLRDAQTNQSVSGASDLISIAGYGDHGPNGDIPVEEIDDILDGNPLFAPGQLGNYYLRQTSPAINAGSVMADHPDIMLGDPYTTDPADAPIGDLDELDLGYHYLIQSPDDKVKLNASVQDGVGDVGVLLLDEEGEPVLDENGERIIIPQIDVPYFIGSVVNLTADIDADYFLTGWSGGTFDDNSREAENVVLMTEDKRIEVLVRIRRTLTMGASFDYDTLGDALNDAVDGDIILVTPGEYTAASQFPSPLNTIVLDGKKVTITGSNPDDEAVIRATIFRDIRLLLSNLNNQTVVEGITLDQSRMRLVDSDPIIRNCVFSDSRFVPGVGAHLDPPGGTDGYNANPIFGGALTLFDSSPQILNCTFENNAVTGFDGENGFAGDEDHPNGGDGGWPSPAYGGAVYCGLSSDPEFVSCTFYGNEAFGGTGGNGADYVVIDDIIYLGGRGGGWVYNDEIETFLRNLTSGGGWDGWTFNTPSNDDKYLSSYYDNIPNFFTPDGSTQFLSFFQEYDFDVWARWFNWSDAYTSWDNFSATYTLDPYDALLDAWRYSAHGGAVFCELDSDATFRDCVFEENQTHGGLTGVGGAQDILTVANAVPWPDRQLNMPTAGGAVFAAADCDLEFTNCTFRNNIADTSTVDLPHTFQISFGGAVAYEYNCSVSFTNCDFEENTATVGGAIYGHYGYNEEIEGSDPMAVIAGCNLFNNEAYLGAGAFIDDNNVSIVDTIFRSNQARVPDPSVVPPEDTLELTGEGAGLYAHVQDLEIIDSVFVENFAELSGGGLLLSGTVGYPTDIFNCLFAGNTAQRDGAGASVNWSSNASFVNCTFADNDSPGISEDDGDDGETVLSPGSGGGLYLGYDSVAYVNDSIFWGNTAAEGEQITVGTGFEFDPRPTELTIAHSNVAGYPSIPGDYVGPNYPSGPGLYVGMGCKLFDYGNMLSENPVFQWLPEASIAEIAAHYYLDQDLSPCIDFGSRLAFDAGLSDYTTSIFDDLDEDEVDLGYHYSSDNRMNPCASADLVLDGKIDLADWAAFASVWFLKTCNEGNNWCNGADMNADGIVDTNDLTSFAFCWLQEDKEAPLPNPAEWKTPPRSVAGTTDKIEMEAVQASDDWIVDGVWYLFQNLTDETHDSGWRQSFDPERPGYWYDENDPDVRAWIYIDSGLTAEQPYTYTVVTRDVKGLKTAASTRASAIPGVDDNPPLPDPSEWAVDGEPMQSASDAVSMEAVQAVDPDDNGVEYLFVCVENGALSSGWQQNADDTGAPGYVATPWIYEVSGLVLDETYTFYVVTRDRSPAQNETAQSASISVTIAEIDTQPPTPDPAQHDVAGNDSPFEIYVPAEGQYYHVVTAVAATDDSGVEYKFVCSNSTFSSGNFSDPFGDVSYDDIRLNDPGYDGWRNVDNVAGLFYPNGDPQTPQQYWAYRGLVGQADEWYILVRDRSPNQNTAGQSESRTIFSP
ncbi:MAG: right-handed parallel beta-helix repeat-containing protein [Planctomycetota bacterium]|jgi:predicted outer membrane repeat protein